MIIIIIIKYQSPNVHGRHQTVFKMWEIIGNSNTRSKNIQSESRDGIWHRKKRHARNEKQETTKVERNCTTKSTLGEKETYKYLGMLEDATIKLMEMRQNQERVFKENQKATQEKTIAQELYQRDPYLGCLPRKIFGTILEVGQRRTKTNGSENKKLMTMHMALHPSV